MPIPADPIPTTAATEDVAAAAAAPEDRPSRCFPSGVWSARTRLPQRPAADATKTTGTLIGRDDTTAATVTSETAATMTITTSVSNLNLERFGKKNIIIINYCKNLGPYINHIVFNLYDRR